jgi:hypothetical protein
MTQKNNYPIGKWAKDPLKRIYKWEMKRCSTSKHLVKSRPQRAVTAY